jgi:SEC-C motif
MGLVIPADPQARALATYDTASLSNVTYGPSHVEGRGGEYGSFAIANPAFRGEDEAGNPTTAAVPKAARNAPCPCGSTLKYKRCHGDISPGITIQIG